MRQRVFVAIGVASLGWGLAGVAVRVAFEEGVEPVTLVMWRSALAGVAVLAYLRATGRSIALDRGLWATGAVMAVFNMVAPFLLFTLAYQYASAGFVGLLTALIPLVTAMLAHFTVSDEPLTFRKLVGMMVALGGVAFLFGSGDSGLAVGGDAGLAGVLGLAAVLSVGFASVHAKRKSASFTPLPITGIQFIIGTALLIPLMLVIDGPPGGITIKGWAMVVFLAVASSFLPFVLFYWVLQHASVTAASLTGYIVPLISLVGGIVLIGERLEAGIVIGGALILVGVVLTDRAERRLASSLRR